MAPHFPPPIAFTPHAFDPLMFYGELAFTIITIVFCYLIYRKTKESYELTRYEGIKYFRLAFLFFGLSYLARFIFSMIQVGRFALDVYLPRELFAVLFIIPMGYLSTVGIFYLIFSSVWKRFSRRSLLLFGHSVAALLSIVSFLAHSPFLLVVLQSVLLVLAVALTFLVHKKGKALSGTKALYSLVFALWLINLWVLERPPFGEEMEMVFNVISVVVFFIIYHKVAKWVR